MFQVIVPVPHVAKTTSSAAAAAMGKDVEAAVTGLVHMFSVSHCFHLAYRDLIAELNCAVYQPEYSTDNNNYSLMLNGVTDSRETCSML